MYHPAAALHQPNLKPVVISDFVVLPVTIEKANRTRRPKVEHTIDKIDTGNTTPEEPEQLSLF
jgi:hypothetical protein